MNTLELMKYVGQTGTLLVKENAGNMEVRVRTLDAKSAYGRPLVLVTPETGTGEVWVAGDRLTLDEVPA